MIESVGRMLHDLPALCLFLSLLLGTISDEAKAVLIAALLPDAITNGFGELGLILFLTWMGAKIMRAVIVAVVYAMR